MEKKVSVILINYNNLKYTADCVSTILESTYTNFFIYIVDNGSTQANYATLKKEYGYNKLITIIRIENNAGYVGGVNTGLEYASRNNPKYFLIMNNDTVIDQRAIEALVLVGEKYSGKAIVTGKVYNYDNKQTLQYIGQAFDNSGLLNYKSIVKNRCELDIGQYDDEMEMGMLDDIYWLLPYRVFEQVGYYSDYFFLYGEQNDYCLRAIKHGVKFIYTPKAKLWHKEGATTAGGNKHSPKIDYWRSSAELKLAKLHLDPSKQRTFIAIFFIRKILKNLLLLCTGTVDFKRIFANYIAFVDFFRWRKIMYKDTGYNPFVKL